MALVQVWLQHYLYSRRYGLQTPRAVGLNSVLLFVVLFYVYPLKFLFTLSIGLLSGRLLAADSGMFQISASQVITLEVIYSLGFYRRLRGLRPSLRTCVPHAPGAGVE